MNVEVRASSLEEFFNKITCLRSEASGAYAKAFEPRASDIIVATFPKAGTTWMQQIVHGLRSGGDMAFGEITEVVPWIEMAGDLDIDLNADHVFEPRAFKSHDTWQDVGKGGRYICVVRDPEDSALSMFNFMNGWFIEPGAISVDEFIQASFLIDIEHRGYWNHLQSWWAVKDEPNVMLLCYEDMKQDLEAVVKRVAIFMGVEDEDAIELATRQAGFEFMNSHNTQFDDHIICEKRNQACGLPAWATTSKVKSGNSGGAAKQLSEDTLTLLAEAWKNTVEQSLGFKDYAELRQALVS